MEGNVQKIREALRELIVAVCDYHENANSLYYGKDIRSVIAVQLNNAREALTLPLCNCDVGTAEDWIRRHESYCGNSMDSFACINGPGSECKKCFAKWLQKPYGEGGAK